MVAFRRILDDFAATQESLNGPAGRRVVGVYVGWPGAPRSRILGTQTTAFWKAEGRADDVTRSGQLTMLFERLARQRDDGDGMLIIIGHSFGARIAFRAVKDGLLHNVIGEGRRQPGDPRACIAGANMVCNRVNGFGDLVVLLNPAFDANQYRLFALMGGGNWAQSVPAGVHVSIESWPLVQPPLMMALGAENDNATKFLYPLAHAFADTELQTTLTNLPRYQTHTLRCADEACCEKLDSKLDPKLLVAPRRDGYAFPGVLDRTIPSDTIGCAVLAPVGAPSNSPFMVAQADRRIIDDHDGIARPALRAFLVAYFLRLQEQRRIRGRE